MQLFVVAFDKSVIRRSVASVATLVCLQLFLLLVLLYSQRLSRPYTRAPIQSVAIQLTNLLRCSTIASF